jgi:hypothetical protein
MFIYTNMYDKDQIIKFSANDKISRILTPIGIYEVADKYDVPNIYEPAAEDVRDVLTNTCDDDFEMLQAAIHAHYGSGANVDGAMGKLITSVVLNVHQTFTELPDFERMMQSYPMFGADVALTLCRNDGNCFLRPRLCKCEICNKEFRVDAAKVRSAGSSFFYCSFCGHRMGASLLPSTWYRVATV